MMLTSIQGFPFVGNPFLFFTGVLWNFLFTSTEEQAPHDFLSGGKDEKRNTDDSI
ncbi:MAG: hypothetical protein WCR31_07020 [Treponema sp.]